MKFLLTIAVLMLVGLSPAAETKGSAEEERAIQDVISGFNEARNGFDIKKITTFFTEDGELIGNTGKVAKGRTALEQLFTKGSEVLKGTRVTRRVTEIRFIKPDVAIVTVVGNMTGTRNLRLLDADVLVKEDGNWRIASQHNIVVAEPNTPSNKKE